MTKPAFFKRDPGYAEAMASLSPRQRTAYVLFSIGAILPIFFLALIRPVFWIAALQLACAAGIAYIRWRSPVLRGSLVLVVVAAFASLVSVVAALAA